MNERDAAVVLCSKTGRLEKQLWRYAFVSGALLALPLATQASVVTNYPPGGATCSDTGIPCSTYAVTMDSSNFTLSFNDGSTGPFHFSEIVASPDSTGGIATDGTYPIAFGYGATIDGSSTYSSSSGQVLLGKQGSIGPPSKYGNWPQNGDPAFLGVEFNPGDGEHYGWIEVEADPSVIYYPSSFTILGWGYETDANTAIMTPAVPEPSSLALLALGATGLVAYRKRRALR